MSANTKKAAKKSAPAHPPYQVMVFAAIAASSHFGHGVSRASIANHIQGNNKVSSGAMFNSALRRCLASMIAKGLVEHGDTNQRFKLTKAGQEARKPKKVKKKKKVAKKKKPTKKKKKKTTKKKKKTTTKKKKKTTTKKKKSATKKKKAASKKKKPASKKKAAGKKKKATGKKKTAGKKKKSTKGKSKK